MARIFSAFPIAAFERDSSSGVTSLRTAADRPERVLPRGEGGVSPGSETPNVRPMSILILTHYFPPELGAPQSRLGFLTRYLVQRGHRVEVLTSFPSYPSGRIPSEYRGRFLVRESWEGARVFRTWTHARPGHSLVNRL